MSKRQSPLALIAKWLIVPILVALLGYFVIGPRIGKVPVIGSKASDTSNQSGNGGDPQQKGGRSAGSTTAG